MSDAAPLFARVLGGASFESLSSPLLQLHRRQGLHRYSGQVQVSRGSTWLSRLLAASTCLPPAGRQPIQVDIEAHDGRETWTRRMAGHAMVSRLWASDGMLCERLGLVRFGFRLEVQQQAIIWRVVRVHALGLIPLPVRWFSQVHAREYAEQGRYGFDVRAAVPLAGLLVHYHGWLDVDG